MKKGIDYIGVAAGAMVFNHEGRVLLAKRGTLARNEKGKWEFPGGAVEFGERCEDAVKREIREEFDIEIEVVGFLHLVDDIMPHEHQHWVGPSYIARHIFGTPRVMEPGKIDEVMWAPLDEIDETLLSNASRIDFREYTKRYGTNPPGEV
jgi:mutator protein MutT